MDEMKGYFFERLRKKGRDTYKLGFDSFSKQHFKFQKEDAIDRFFKAINLTKEHQLDNKLFNEEIYIVSDSNEFLRDVNKSEEIQKLIMELFTFNIESLECDGEKIFITYKEKYSYNSGLQEDVYKSKITFLLKEINKHLSNFYSSKSNTDSVAKKWSIFNKALYIALIIGFILQAIYINIYSDKFVYGGIFKHSLYFSLPLFIAWLIPTTKFFIGTSRGHYALIVNLIMGLPAFILWAYVSTVFINISYDDSPKEVITTIVQNKEMTKNKSNYTYKVIVQHWEVPNSNFTIVSSKEEYEKLNIGSTAELTVRKGFLGYKWIEKWEFK